MSTLFSVLTLDHLCIVHCMFVGLFTDQTAIGRVMNWVMKHGAEKMALNLKAMQNPAKVCLKLKWMV